MSRGRAGECVFRALLRAYPRAFRERYAADLIAFFRQDRERQPAGLRGSIGFWFRTVRDVLRVSGSLRAEARTENRVVRHATQASSPGDPLWRRVLAELRDARRSLAATPGITALAVLVLTLGIGASTTIFAVADAIALRGLPFRHADELVAVSETDLSTGRRVTVAPQNYLDWNERQRVFAELGASNFVSVVLRNGEESERLLAARLTPSLLPLLRVSPVRGRLFTDDDALPGRDRVALVSDTFWRTRLGAAPDVLGQTLKFDDGPRQIIGVMPPDFEYPLGSRTATSVGLWLPLTLTAADRNRDGGRTYSLTVIARLRPGTGLEAARAQMRDIRDALAVEYPRWFEDHGVNAEPLDAFVVSDSVRSWSLLMLGAVALVLLIACANVANLLLTRLTGRARDFGIRAALGASKGDLLRGVAVESLVIAMMSVAGGWLLAQWGVSLVQANLPNNVSRLSMIVLDGRVFAVASAIGVGTAMLVTIAPAFGMTRMDVSGRLREFGRANTGTRAHQRVGAALVVAEVSLSIVLLVGAGLFVASFVRILQRDLGFDPDGVVSLSVAPPTGPISLGAAPAADAALGLRLARVLEQLQATPGVEAAALVNGGVPLGGSSRSNAISVPGRDEPFSGPDDVFIREVTPGYLDALRLRLASGRWLSDRDVRGGEPVVVLNDEARDRYFGGRNPVGQTVTIADDVPRRVVGVVARTRFRGPESEPPPEAFVPLAQADVVGGTFVVRVRDNADASMPALKNAVWTAAPEMTVASPRTLNDMFRTLITQRRFNMLLVAVFGVLAVLLVFAGIFGVMAYSVSQRSREIGVRMALGARPSTMLRMVLARAALLAGAGFAIGGVAAAALERFARGFLFQPPARDVVVYVSVAVLLIVVTLAAALVPARRASLVDPLESLRE